MTVTSQADRLAAGFLRERLQAQLDWHQSGEPFRLLRTPIGLASVIRDSVDLLPRDGEDAWRDVAARLAAIPVMFASWPASLDAGLDQGLTAARGRRSRPRSKSSATWVARRPGRLLRRGPARGRARGGRRAADQGYAELARYLREDYAPRAREVDGSALSGTRSRPGSAWAPTSTCTRPTSGAGPSCAGSRPRWRPKRTRSARAPP